MKKLFYMLVTAAVLCEAASAQTLGRIEIHNSTGYRLTYNIWSGGSWNPFALDSGYTHIFDDSAALTLLIKTSNGDRTLGSHEYLLSPGNTYEFVNDNGVWDLNDNQQYFPTRLAPHIVQDDNGTYQPAPAYAWVDKDDTTNFQVRLQTGLVELPGGAVIPAPGYDWLYPYDANDPGNRRNFYVWLPPNYGHGRSEVHEAQGGQSSAGAGGGVDRGPANVTSVTVGTADMIHAMLPDAIKAIQDHNAQIDEAVEHINNGKGGNGGKSQGGNGAGNSGSNSGGNSSSGNNGGNGNGNGGGDHHGGSGDAKH